MIITIDGPSVSGKTTVARMLARHLQYQYLASGLLFRGLAYALTHALHYTESTLAHATFDDIAAALSPQIFKYEYSCQVGERLFFKGTDITALLADEKIGMGASLIGSNPFARAGLAALQHAIADNKNTVTDGRDAGSVIFPCAAFKFFLTASLEERAMRWQKNQQAKGRAISIEQAHSEISERDARDSNRPVAPLRVPEGAVIIDSSGLRAEQVLQKMLDVIENKPSA